MADKLDPSRDVRSLAETLQQIYNESDQICVFVLPESLFNRFVLPLQGGHLALHPQLDHADLEFISTFQGVFEGAGVTLLGLPYRRLC